MPQLRVLKRLLLLALLPAFALADDTGPEQPAPRGIQWQSLLLQSWEFLMLEHAVRYGTDPEVRSSHLPFFRGYVDSVGNLHGWADGDPFLVNYVGHPIQGSITGFVFAQNDERYKDAVF